MSTAMRPSGVVCDPRCGCPVPCPGGAACRCAAGGRTEGDPSIEHRRCPCGEHCGCNPCTCPESTTTAGTGKANCKCGDGCTCATCAA